MVSQPQFLLFCDTHTPHHPSPLELGETHGRWHFVLDRLDQPQRLEATDCEPAIHPDRLALLSVVRGLEALDEPSQVNLVTTSRYVSRGLKYGLASWRASHYRWEHFGVQRPVRNADLWQRVDRAMNYHGVSCRLLQPQAVAAEVELENRAVLPTNALEETYPAARTFVPHNQDLAAIQATLQQSHGTSLKFRPDDRLSDGHSEHRLHAQPALYFSWYMLRNWWEMAWNWFKWWRRRTQARPAIFGM